MRDFNMIFLRRTRRRVAPWAEDGVKKANKRIIIDYANNF